MSVSSTSRKRTHQEIASVDIDRRPFSIRQEFSDPFAKPRTFTPICLLSRSQLPLAWLDTAHDGSRIFTADLRILEDGERTTILVVEEENEGRLYAVERAQRKRYALCRLAEKVTRGHFEQMSGIDGAVVESQRKRRAVPVAEGGSPWWMAASVEVDAERKVTKKDVPKLSMLRIQDHMRSANAVTVGATELRNSNVPIALAPKNQDTVKSPTTTQDPPEELAKAYLDALYLSRTPIAFFVKGPLARARAAFVSQPTELITFLRTSILSTTTADKKYHEKIPEHIKDLPLLETPEGKPKPKKKRKWKSKRDKYGFFVDEKDYVEQWWKGGDDIGTSFGSAERLEDAIRRRSQRVRSRETFLQVVLILETMALEASAAKSPAPATAAAEPQNLESQAEESQAVAGERKARKKKELDMSKLLDILLDRLSMWYLIDSGSPVKGLGDSEENQESSDELRNFASEVIIPFFSARIRDQANAASKKLGGPRAMDPGKAKPSASRKPGEPAIRQPPAQKPRKPFERVSSDTLNRPGRRTSSLHRAATDSDTLTNMIKHETSETPPLDSIPMSRQRSQPKNQPGVRKRPSLLESMARREVDLSAISQANEAKLRKKAELEERVRDAITTIHKPNRARAVEETAKNADESFARAIANGKSNNQRKTTSKNAVAITATPRHVKATPAPKRHVYQGPDYSYGSAGACVVPATSARQRAQPAHIPSSALAVPQTGHRPRHGLVEDTPSRGFNKFMPPALSRTPGTLLESPTATRKSQIHVTPAKVSRMPSLMESPLSKVPGSTLKGRTYSPMKNVAASPTKADGREDSGVYLDNSAQLYNSLGWDEDEDYEELP